MNSSHISDLPITNPDNDLLGMKPHAGMLAEFIKTIKPPFIIGVYGQWGEGKTSYVDMAIYFLDPQKDKKVIPVGFSAWPYTTSDELWRALTLEIAQKVCSAAKIGSSQTNDTSVPLEQAAKDGHESDSFISLLAKFLSGNAIAFRREPEPSLPQDSCVDIETSLNKGLTRSISRRPEAQIEINQEAALMAIVSSTLAAVGSISPLLAGIRNLLGLNKEIDLSEIIRKKKDEATQENLDSIQKLKDTLKKIFNEKVQDKTVIVFIDDLDRCLPNVALDLLEAIKIFFAEVNCIFLVAADERLIGQGLRLRYHDLFDQGDPQKAEELLTLKGREYFEKVIQFGVQVPARTPEQIHHFISALYPIWTPVTDIIQCVVGDNPRRLKQYCNFQSFKYKVRQIQDEDMDFQR